MKMLLRPFAIGLILASPSFLVSCEKSESEKMEDAIEDVGDAVGDAAEEVADEVKDATN